MLRRCLYPKSKDWKNYGGRGIGVCDRWRKFSLFCEDMGIKPSPTYQLDRFPDNNGNYEPGNVRWATPEENSNNKRNNRVIEFRGFKATVAQWSKVTGLPNSTIHMRLNDGWEPEKILFTSALKMFCKRGHRLDGDNCVERTDSKRGSRCRICRNETVRRYRSRKHANASA